MLKADVLHHSSPLPSDPFQWTSTFLDSVTSLLPSFVKRLLCQGAPVPEDTLRLLRRPLSLGGLGFRDHRVSAVPTFVIPIARSIRLATHGFTQGAATAYMPRAHQLPFLAWESSPERQFTLFRSLAPALLHIRFTHAVPVSDLVFSVDLDSAVRDVCKLYLKFHAPSTAFTASAPPTLLHNESAFDVAWMTRPLHNLPRTQKNLRLPPDLYRIIFARRSGLPIVPPDIVAQGCPFCGKAVDKEGSHFFRCRVVTKTRLSNDHRDSVATVLAKVAPLAGFVSSSQAVKTEPRSLLPDNITKRLADVGFPLRPTYLSAPPPSHLAT